MDAEVKLVKVDEAWHRQRDLFYLSLTRQEAIKQAEEWMMPTHVVLERWRLARKRFTRSVK